MLIKIEWPSTTATKAELWRILDLSGMTNSVRESRNFTKAGFLYFNGNLTKSLKAKVSVGEIFTLELRFTNGVIKSRELMVVSRVPRTASRSLEPTQKYYRG